MRVNTLGKNLVILRAGHNVDVFYGTDGWSNHSRFHTKRTNKGLFFKQVSGDVLPVKHFKTMLNEVN